MPHHTHSKASRNTLLNFFACREGGEFLNGCPPRPEYSKEIAKRSKNKWESHQTIFEKIAPFKNQ